ncbi:MAG: DUF4249 domain-containing protein [Bacteroidota bacterium]|nr:MAG: DUF4249 domain-containing protein [Bacteroidota bacterium]
MYTSIKKYFQNLSSPFVPFLLLSVPVLFFLNSCQEPLETEFKGELENLLVVEGKITTDTTRHYVLLSRTQTIDKSDILWETGADVRIEHPGGEFILQEEVPGHYYTNPDVYGIIGANYTLHITLTSGETYHAETFIANIPEIDSVKFIYEEFENYEIFSHNLYYHGWELEEPGNAYLWNLYINDSLYNDSIFKTNFVDDEFVNGNYIGATPLTDKDGNEYLESTFAVYMLEPEEIKRDTNRVLVEMESLPKPYYEFWTTYMQMTYWTGSPFDANKADILTNLSGDALGYFYGASVRRYSFVYIRPEGSDKPNSHP